MSSVVVVAAGLSRPLSTVRRAQITRKAREETPLARVGLLIVSSGNCESRAWMPARRLSVAEKQRGLMPFPGGHFISVRLPLHPPSGGPDRTVHYYSGAPCKPACSKAASAVLGSLRPSEVMPRQTQMRSFQTESGWLCGFNWRGCGGQRVA